jgi:ABC-type phosphate/phosphonate transport system ATPase subunit
MLEVGRILSICYWYADDPVLLLDDPLSSLDQNTAEYIVEHCLRSDLVEDRTVILVTHRLDLVKGFATQRIAVKDSQATVSEDFEVDEKHSDSSTLGAEEEPGKQEATAVDLAVTQPAKAFESQ